MRGGSCQKKTVSRTSHNVRRMLKHVGEGASPLVKKALRLTSGVTGENMNRIAIALASLALFVLQGHAKDVTYYYTSPQGTVLAKADEKGNLLSTSDYRSFGSTALGQILQGPGYTGHVQDAENDLVYMQARYYDPGTGRFLSTDIVSETAGNVFNFNKYAYVNNNPFKYVDPDGRMIGIRSDFRGDYYENGGEQHSCLFCLSSESKAAFGSNEVSIGAGYVGRADKVPGTDLYEVHVYEDSTAFRKALRGGASDLDRFEVGVMGSRGEWLAKHGHDAVPSLPGEANNALRGYAAEMARARGWLPVKGEVNIRGARLAAAIERGMERTGSAAFLRDIGRSLGPVAGTAGLLFGTSVDSACSSGVAQAGGLGGDLHCDD